MIKEVNDSLTKLPIQSSSSIHRFNDLFADILRHWQQSLSATRYQILICLLHKYTV